MRITYKKYHDQEIFCIFSILFFFLHYHIHFIESQSPPSDIYLDCGSLNDGNDLSERTWKADRNGPYFSLVDDNKSKIQAAIQRPRQVEAVPYETARLSGSPFTYSFVVTSGQKFVRLHFYPTSYSEFNSSNAFFSVRAGRYTLLSNFSAAHHAHYLELEGFSKEFCLNIEDGEILNVTFVPSQDIPDSYAFINGVEIVSMPLNLYYSNESSLGVDFLGQGSPLQIGKNLAMAVMYRVNVGGSTINLKQDPRNMFRSWSGDDQDYLTVDKTSVLPFNLTTDLLSFNVTPNYSAPEEVYKTARSMGMDGAINREYNLTWEFQVDSGFTYLIRLHFCEIETPIQNVGDRQFRIYIANQTAEKTADIIMWTGRNGVPVYRDYAVQLLSQGNQKLQNLSIALQALSAKQTVHSDAILNGVEIFKLSNSDDLSGPNPDVPLLVPPAVSTPSSKPQNKEPIGAIIGGAAAGFVVLSLLLFFVFLRRQRSTSKYMGHKDEASRFGQFSVASTRSSKTQGSSLPSDLCRRFSLAEIKAATNSFDSLFIIGVGGFGNVYKGLINDGAVTVAIKRLNPGSEQGAREFKTEIEMLSQLRYLHLVSLIGYCYEEDEMVLVYDYMAKGTLRDHLYKTENPPLSWVERLQICIGAAKGLQYLHSGAKNNIIHRDVKSTNILLDEKWVAKVSDFGLSKFGPNNAAKPHISTVVKGSFGYLDPEYYHLQRLTEKSDVYSFGVVLCEVLSARPPVSKSSFNRPVSLAEWARQCYKKGKLDDLVDPNLQGKIAPDCLKKFFELAISCLQDSGVDRPSMNDVVWGLEFALELQKTAVKQHTLQTEINIDDNESPLIGSSVHDSSDDLFSSSGSALFIGSRLSGMTLTSSSDERSFLSNSSDPKSSSGAVFSQIMNPEGR